MFGVSSDVMFQVISERLMRCGTRARFGNLSVKLARLVQNRHKNHRREMSTSVSGLFMVSRRSAAERLPADLFRDLCPEHELVPSGRRFRDPNCTPNRFHLNFVCF